MPLLAKVRGGGIKVVVTGADSLQLALAGRMSPKAVDRALAKASSEAAKVVAKAAKPNAPVGKTGRLKRAVGIKTARYERPGAIARINPGKRRADIKGAYYRHIVVHGTKGIRELNSGAKVAVKPIPARPFLDDAFSANAKKAEQAYADTLEKFINNEVFRRKVARF